MDHDFLIPGDAFLLRPIREGDLESLRKWRNNTLNRKSFFDQRTIEYAEHLTWFKKYLENENDIMFVIEKTEDLKIPIGTISLYNIDYTSSKAEFGRLLIGDTDSRGRGIAHKATKELCKFGFECLGLDNIFLEVFSDNQKAIGIYEKANFKVISDYNRNDRKVLVMNLESSDFVNKFI